MCGRFAQTKELSILISRFHFIVEDIELRSRYNIAPGQDVAALVFENNARRLKIMRWGLVPSWSKDKPSGVKRINARAENLASKPSFRHCLRKKRCLIPADGYYEWKKLPDGKTRIPYHIALENREPFAFAGLWDSWKNPDGVTLESFTIITTKANELSSGIHDRMPAILTPESEDAWLDPAITGRDDLLPLLAPYPSEKMIAFEVSSLVNSPRNDTPECIRKSIAPRQGSLFD